MPLFKSENALNEFIADKVRKLGTSYKVLKASDRFKTGIPDFFFFHGGRCVAAETKFVNVIPSKGSLLKHPVTGPQNTYLTGLSLAGVKVFVLLGVNEDSCIYALSPELFDNGNLDTKYFRENRKNTPQFTNHFGYDNIKGLVNYIFLEKVVK